MKVQRLFLGFLAIMLLGALAFSAATQDSVTIRYFTPFSGDSDEKERALIEACESELGITVDYTAVTGTGVGELMAELRAQATAGQLPDVFWMSSGFVDEFAQDGLLYNIQEYVDRDIMPIGDQYFTAAFDAGRWPDKNDGDMYAFPNHFVETVLYYNIDAFDAAGLEYPAADWTWDDFLAAAEALTIDENNDGLMDQYGYYVFGRYAHVESWVYQNNGRWLNADKSAFEPNDAAIETAEFLVSLVNEHGVAPKPAEMEGIGNPFAEGIAAMWVDGSWAIGSLRDSDVNFGIAGVPRGPQWTEDTAYGWSDMTSVGATTEHPEEAWALVRCLTGEARTTDLVEDGKIPVFRAAAGEAWLETDQLPANKDLLLSWADHIGPTSFTPGWGEWRGYVGGAGLQGQLDEAFNGNISVADAIAASSEVANAVLQRFYGE
jgi:multiple sugar transport system substrate-binding protein